MEAIRARVSEATEAAPALNIEFGANRDMAVIRVPSVSVGCEYRNNKALESARLRVFEFRGHVLLPAEIEHHRRWGLYFREPTALAVIEFTPELTEEHGWCWRPEGAVRSTSEIADLFVARFFDLVDKQSAGKLPELEP